MSEMSKQEWQDISTAPKDGTPILMFKRPRIYSRPYVWGYVRICRWSGNYWFVAQSGSIDAEENFTHWMPLPEPPK